MNTVTRFIQICCLMTLAACGGGGGDDGGSDAPPPPAPTPPSPPPPPPVTYTVGGTVTGLQGSGLVLRNAGADLAVGASGSFAFAAGLTTATNYDVTIVTQPSQPTQTCTINGGQGQVQTANVTSILVECRVIFELLSTAPTDGSQEVTRGIQPTLTFSATLDPATVTPGLATLSSIGGEETITVSANDAILSITPSRALLPLTDYTLTVGNTLLSSSGATLPDSVQINFRTREAAWGAQELLTDTGLSGGGLNATFPRIVADAAGNTTSFWLNERGLNKYDLWTRYRPAGGVWEPPVRLDESDQEDVADIVAATDDSGTVTLAWAQTENSAGGDYTRIFSKRFTAAGGWQPIQLVAQSTGNHSMLQLAMRGDGTAMLVWYESTSSSNSIMASRFDPATGWTVAQRIDAATGVVSWPQIAVSDGGIAFAAWQQTLTGPGADIFAARYDAAGGWGAPVHLSVNFNPLGASSVATLAASPAGLAVVSWKQGISVLPYISASFFTPAQGWSAPERLENGPGNSDLPKVAMDHLGTAHAVWRQTISGNSHVHASRRDPATNTWSLPQAISGLVGNASAFDPAITIDRRGNALAAWHELAIVTTPQYQVRGNRYTPQNDWGGAESIGTPDRAITAFSVQLTTDGAGTGWATWSQRDLNNARQIHVNRFE